MNRKRKTNYQSIACYATKETGKDLLYSFCPVAMYGLKEGQVDISRKKRHLHALPINTSLSRIVLKEHTKIYLT